MVNSIIDSGQVFTCCVCACVEYLCVSVPHRCAVCKGTCASVQRHVVLLRETLWVCITL